MTFKFFTFSFTSPTFFCSHCYCYLFLHILFKDISRMCVVSVFRVDSGKRGGWVVQRQLLAVIQSWRLLLKFLMSPDYFLVALRLIFMGFLMFFFSSGREERRDWKTKRNDNIKRNEYNYRNSWQTCWTWKDFK